MVADKSSTEENLSSLPHASILQAVKAYDPVGFKWIINKAEEFGNTRRSADKQKREKQSSEWWITRRSFWAGFLTLDIFPVAARPRKFKPAPSSISSVWLLVGNDLRLAIQAYITEKKINPRTDLNLSDEQMRDLYAAPMDVSLSPLVVRDSDASSKTTRKTSTISESNCACLP
jgi:hypothetical protein